MDLLLTQSQLAAWLIVLARLLGWAWVDPLMGRLPWSLRLVLAGALAWVWVPGLDVREIEPFTAAGGIALAISFLAGAVLGFAARLLVAVAETALPLLGLTAALGQTQVAPEQKGGLDPVLQALAWWLALLAFFSANGHLLVIQAVGASFAAIPPLGLPDAASVRGLVEAGGTLLAAALQLSLPLLVLVLLAHFAFAVLARTAPGVDAYSVGLALGAFALLGGIALAVPVMVSSLAGLFAGLIPQLMP
jgi:flagellar biosynthetic protein FliR